MRVPGNGMLRHYCACRHDQAWPTARSSLRWRTVCFRCLMCWFSLVCIYYAPFIYKMTNKKTSNVRLEVTIYNVAKPLPKWRFLRPCLDSRDGPVPLHRSGGGVGVQFLSQQDAQLLEISQDALPLIAAL